MLKNHPISQLTVTAAIVLSAMFTLPNPALAQENEGAIEGVVAILPIQWSPEVKSRARLKEPELPNVFRAILYKEFEPLGYQDIPLETVDSKLKDAGLAQEEQLEAADGQALADALGCQGVLSGSITKFSTTYSVLYNEVQLEAVLTLTAVPSGEVIWSKTQKQSLHGGIVLKSGQALDVLGELQTSDAKVAQEVQVVVSDTVGALLRSMPPPKLTSVTVPLITSTKVIKEGDKVGNAFHIAFQGTPGCKASFDLAGLHRGIPAIEVEPGLYQGLYVLQEGDLNRIWAVIACLTDSLGLLAEKPVEGFTIAFATADSSAESTGAFQDIDSVESDKKKDREKRKSSKSLVEISPDWDRREPIKIAVLPFTIEKKGKAEGTAVLRREIYSRLGDVDGFELIEPAAVDFLLQKAGIDPSAASDENPQKLGELLDVDAVLAGTVTKWGKSYVIVETTITAEGEIRLIHCADGELLWRTRQKAKYSKGLTRIPTGIGGLAFSTLSALAKKDVLYQLAAQLAESMAATLNPNNDLKKNEEAKPEPELKKISAEAVPDGGIQLTMQAEPDCRAVYSLTRDMSNLPFSEIAPGLYKATFLPLPEFEIEPQSFKIRLFNSDGLSAEKNYIWKNAQLEPIPESEQ